MADENAPFLAGLRSEVGKVIGGQLGGWLAPGALVLLGILWTFLLTNAHTWGKAADELSPRLLLALLSFVGVALLVVMVERRRLRTELARRTTDRPEFVAHYGVKWRMSDRNRAIQETPYCLCCERPKPLTQTATQPQEVFRCVGTGHEYRLLGGIVTRAEAAEYLHRGYFVKGDWLREQMAYEFNRLQALDPNRTTRSIVCEMLGRHPLNKIPWRDRSALLARFPMGEEVLRFISQHYTYYGPHVERPGRATRFQFLWWLSAGRKRSPRPLRQGAEAPQLAPAQSPTAPAVSGTQG